MDTLWNAILHATHAVMHALDVLLAPVNAVHPLAGIILLAVCTVALARFLSAHCTTKRYQRLQEEFTYWYTVRQEALSADPDPEKAKALAKNIDQSTLNKVYYDFFFEGLLLNLVTTYLPILCVAGYINEAYKPDRLRSMLGSPHILNLQGWMGLDVTVSPLFIYALALIAAYIASKFLWRRKPDQATGKTTAPASGENIQYQS